MLSVEPTLRLFSTGTPAAAARCSIFTVFNGDNASSEKPLVYTSND